MFGFLIFFSFAFVTATQINITDDWIQYIEGDIPLIITVPHGGSLKPESMADRTYGIFDMDLNTIPTTLAIYDAFKKKTGHSPHLVINNLDRTKLDANRPVEEAAQGDSMATLAWEQYQHYIVRGRLFSMEQCGKGLLLDLHGQSHPPQWIEIGSGVGCIELNFPDDMFESQAPLSNLRAMAQRAMEKGMTYNDIIKGENSLGGMLQSRGYNSVPSHINNETEGPIFFYDGRGSAGTTADTYGSSRGGVIDSSQLELMYSVRADENAWIAFADVFVDVMIKYFELYYEVDLNAGTVCYKKKKT